MNRKVCVVVIIAVFAFLNLYGVSFAADKTVVAPKAAAAKKVLPPKANFGMLAGTIESIDNSNPADVKIAVKNDADGSVHTVSVTPWTNITKVTDISELKAGEQVRMMTRKTDDKDVAMGIMFGKMKSMPVPAPKAAPVTQTQAASVKK